MCIGKFAAQNAKAKEKVSASQRATQSVESVRDMFIRILIVVAKNTHFDPTKYPYISTDTIPSVHSPL